MMRTHMERWGWKGGRQPGPADEDTDDVSAAASTATPVLFSRREMQKLQPHLSASLAEQRFQVYDAADASTVASAISQSEDNRSIATVEQSWSSNRGASFEKENSFASLAVDVVIPSPRVTGENFPSLSDSGRNLPTPLGQYSRKSSLEGSKHPPSTRSLSSLAADVTNNSTSKSSSNYTQHWSSKIATPVDNKRFKEIEYAATKKAATMELSDVVIPTNSADHDDTTSSGRSQESTVPASFSNASSSSAGSSSMRGDVSSVVSAGIASSNPDGKLLPIDGTETTRPESGGVQDEGCARGDSFDHKWAYSVWRSKGLMPAKRNEGSFVQGRRSLVDDSFDTKLRTIRDKSMGQPVAPGRRSLPATQATWKKREGENFSNILQSWKSVSADKPFISPGQIDLPPRETLVQTSSACRTNPLTLGQISSASRTNPLRGGTKKTLKVVGLDAPLNPAASIPIPQPRDSSLSPPRTAPKSQAWKLKMAREQRTHEKMKRESMPCERRLQDKQSQGNAMDLKPLENVRKLRSPAKSYKSLVLSFLRDMDDKQHRPEAAPRSAHRTESTPAVPAAAVAPSAPRSGTGGGAPTAASAGRGASNQKHPRAQSQPRGRQHMASDSASSAARAQLEGRNDIAPESFAPPSAGSVKMTSRDEASSKKNVDGLSTQKRALVKDLVIGHDDGPRRDCSIPLVVQISTTDESELFSPYTLRVMRNLDKVYDPNDNVETPRGGGGGGGTLDRPWQRDRFLHRVEGLADQAVSRAHGDGAAAAAAAGECRCACTNSVFSGNDDMIDFFLPLMGTACACGGGGGGGLQSTLLLAQPDEATSLGNILRPWQVSFLGGFGIYRGEELVKANHRSGAALAKALQVYRKREGMAPFRTKSCVMALQIWSKTSKAFVRSIRSQLRAAKAAGGAESPLAAARPRPAPPLRLPNALYILSSFLEKMPDDDDGNGAPRMNFSAGSISTCSPTSFYSGASPANGTASTRTLLRPASATDPPHSLHHPPDIVDDDDYGV